MTHIQLTKTASFPDRPDGTGAAGPINAGYVVKGYCTHLPEVGERFNLTRYERNGVNIYGHMSTSPVSSVVFDDKGADLETENSRYRLDFLGQLTEVGNFSNMTTATSTQPSTPQDLTVCQRAIVAYQNQLKIDAEAYAARRQEFLKSVFGADVDKLEFHADNPKLFDLCGHVWRVTDTDKGRFYIRCETQYNGTYILWHDEAMTFTEFGQLLSKANIRLDIFKEEYPNTIWGRFKQWVLES